MISKSPKAVTENSNTLIIFRRSVLSLPTPEKLLMFKARNDIRHE